MVCPGFMHCYPAPESYQGVVGAGIECRSLAQVRSSSLGSVIALLRYTLRLVKWNCFNWRADWVAFELLLEGSGRLGSGGCQAGALIPYLGQTREKMPFPALLVIAGLPCSDGGRMVKRRGLRAPAGSPCHRNLISGSDFKLGFNTDRSDLRALSIMSWWQKRNNKNELSGPSQGEKGDHPGGS